METVGSLARLVDGRVHGDADIQIHRVADLASAGPNDLSFLTHPKYAAQFMQTNAAAVLTAEEIEPAPCTLLVCKDPYLALARIATHLLASDSPPPGVEPGAHVHPEALVAPDATVRVGAIVEAGARIGARSLIGPGCYVGPEVAIGAHALLHPGVKVLARCILGDRVILHPGAVIGADGFGYAVDGEGRRHKIPQTGIVVLEDDVEVGANATVDRATFGVTRIGARTKVDNLVQIAHNVSIGEDCVVVSQSGIAGSATLGNRVIMGAKAGVVGHVRIGDDVSLGARSGVAGSLESKGVYSGVPAIPHREWLRMVVAQKDLPALRRRLTRLEKRLAVIENEAKA